MASKRSSAVAKSSRILPGNLAGRTCFPGENVLIFGSLLKSSRSFVFLCFRNCLSFQVEVVFLMSLKSSPSSLKSTPSSLKSCLSSLKSCLSSLKSSLSSLKSSPLLKSSPSSPASSFVVGIFLRRRRLLRHRRPLSSSGSSFVVGLLRCRRLLDKARRPLPVVTGVCLTRPSARFLSSPLVTTFICRHSYLSPLPFVTTFICHHFHLSPLSFVTLCHDRFFVFVIVSCFLFIRSFIHCLC